MEVFRNVAVPPQMSVKDIDREELKDGYWNIIHKLRKDRKAFLQMKLKGKKASAGDYPLGYVTEFRKMVNGGRYKEYKVQVCDVLVEGIKSPKKEIQEYCNAVFNEIQEKTVDTYLWKKILSANFIPKVAQAYIKKNRSRLEANSSISYLLDNCEAKFSGTELMAADFQAKEAVKARIEDLILYVHWYRKKYRMDQNVCFVNLLPDWVKQIQSFLKVDTYLEYPIQLADLVYEGCKSPDIKVEQMSLNFVEELLKLAKLDVYFWTKMLASDWVPDAIWVLLQKYPEVFEPQKEDLGEFIKKKDDEGRSKTSDAVYAEVVKMYCKSL